MTASAYARSTDPHTSWEAAEALSDDEVRASQQLVLSYIREVEDALHADLPGRSRTRLRTACSELRDLGLLEIADYAHPTWSPRTLMILQPTKREEQE